MTSSSLRRHRRTASALVCLSLSLSACSAGASASEDGSGLSGELVGAGSSAQSAAMQVWQAGFQNAHHDVTVNYDPIGSGGGRAQFLAGAVEFAGSDAFLDEEELAEAEERCNGAGVVELPNYISPIAIAFNVPGVASLNLTPATLAGIFSGQITSWSDPAIAAANPGVDLPDLRIIPVHRSDESGTTETFTDYLAAVASGTWQFEPSGDWPSELGGEAAQGNAGVIQAIEAGAGTIGYADASQAGDLATAAIGADGNFVEYSPEAAARVVELSERVPGRGPHDLALDLAHETPGTYPIVLVSYQIACAHYDDAETVELLKPFLRYVASEEGQQAAAEHAGSAPISDGLRKQVLEAIDSISSG